MKEEIVLIGGGGHCKACIDVIEMGEAYKIVGIVDLKEKIGQKVLGYKIIASDRDLLDLSKEYKNFFITVGQIKSAQKRVQIFKKLKKLNAKLPVIKSPLAKISAHSILGEGTIVMHNATINADTKVGMNCIINSGSIIEHDVTIGNHCHISTGAIVNGYCSLDDECFIGSNATLLNNITIANSTIIGAGSVVIKSINKSGIFVGNPARRIG
ncbi:acetyltransferase [Desulfohalobiaceae bacterium Ax17]|uniref:acetyltransferase n=1 Tax=Desulfovulcanus ferrireducens TaxID=2831190 RepID=UPI00207BCD70|nr:acetyltransferase [Desulfovulcanus ferrireducens]MBT8763521.1 acetyltransferase [Desulfovulcanus ferrireducens]